MTGCSCHDFCLGSLADAGFLHEALGVGMTEGEAQTIPYTVNSGDGDEYSQARKDTYRCLLGGQVLEHTVLCRQLSVHRRKTVGQ